jgi:hypothetical protein
MHHRRSIRLKGYDYTQAGAYFLTLCTHNRECLFGDVVDGEMVLNKFGKIADYQWHQIPRFFPNTVLDEFIAMPNHFHGITMITADNDIVDHIVGAKHPVHGFGWIYQNVTAGASPLLRVCRNGRAVRYGIHCRPLFKISFRSQPVKSIGYERHQIKNYGNVIITNTSSAMKAN